MSRKIPPKGSVTPEGAYATVTEVEGAWKELSVAELNQLTETANFRASALRALGFGIDGNDILQEAIARTLNGIRKWRRGVSFLGHLFGTMRSIASHAAEELKGGVVAPGDDPDEDGDAFTPPDAVEFAARFPKAERIAEAHEKLQALYDHFRDDERVLLILEGLETEMSGPEIQRALGISQTEYETAMKRLRRWAAREKEQEPVCPR
jgi:DNA-directed RNA polymerase specialized sigma24 family protein